MDKKFFLHIGCGKTGSSALQLWLNHIAPELRAAGCHYPTFMPGKLPDYAITSGNGIHLIRALDNGSLRPFLAEIAGKAEGCDILFSSEQFQRYTTDTRHALEQLKEAIAEIGYRPVIVAYVRDLYDIVYSSYLQGVKRHFYTVSFREWGCARQDIQQFDVVRLWAGHFDAIELIHYDSEREMLEKSFCRALGIDASALPPMAKARINRSLAPAETELMLFVNRRLIEAYHLPHINMGAHLSDALIMADPELSTPILLDHEVLAHLTTTFTGEVDWINATFFGGENRLRLFSAEGKEVVEEQPPMPSCYRIMLEQLFHRAPILTEADSYAITRSGGYNPERAGVPQIVNIGRLFYRCATILHNVPDAGAQADTDTLLQLAKPFSPPEHVELVRLIGELEQQRETKG